MTTADIIAAIANCNNYTELEEIRAALDAKSAELKAAFMAQAKAMGLACRDGNGKPRKPRASKQQQSAD
jgi:hypothetical protein